MKEINQQKPLHKEHTWFHAIVMLVTTSLSLYSGYAFATTYANIGQVASTVTSSFDQLAQLITAGAYIAGMGFALGAILKFKQHKDNPTQVTIGQPIAMLFIAAALIFLPYIFGIAGSTIFGPSATPGGPTGVSTF